MRIVGTSGNVGIGTTSPGSTRFKIVGTTALFEAAGTNNKGIYIGDATDGVDIVGSSGGTYNNIKFRTSGTEGQLFLKTDGNIGIGTTSPFGLLSVEQGTETASLWVGNTGSTTPSLMVSGVNGNGHVGIGTSTPAVKLDISNNTGALPVINAGTLLRLAQADGVATRMSLDAFGSHARLDFRRADGTAASPSALQTNDIIATITALGYGTTGYSLSRADIIMLAGENWTDSSQPTYITLRTTPSGAAAATERVRIDMTGNVGIGTTSPWRTLSVTGTVGFDGLTTAVGLGSLCLDTNKQVVYNASDACLSSTRATKHDIESLTVDAFDIIDQLQSVSFVYNDGDGRTRYGFIAEDTAAVASSLATYNDRGEITGIDDRAILSVVVRGVKEMVTQITDMALQLNDLAATVLGFQEEFTTKRLCLGETCITETELRELLEEQDMAPAESSSDAESAPQSETESAETASLEGEAVESETPSESTSSEATTTEETASETPPSEHEEIAAEAEETPSETAPSETTEIDSSQVLAP
jgi:hypothetical protein